MQSNHTASESLLAGLQLERENMEDVKHLKPQKRQGGKYDGDGQNLAKIQAASARVETAQYQSENVEGRKAKNQDPKHVVNIVLTPRIKIGEVRQLKEKNGESLQPDQAPRASEGNSVGQCGS